MPGDRGVGRQRSGHGPKAADSLAFRPPGRVEAATKVGNNEAIVPSIEGWARITGFNTIFIDDRDPYAHGFQVL